MKNISETITKIHGNYPEKILQFGEGNFLRAFADWMINKANQDGVYQGSIILCQPVHADKKERFHAQDNIYTLAMRGLENGAVIEKEEGITSISRCISASEDFNELKQIAKNPDLEVIISNTTEAGIVYREGDRLTDTPPSSFPAKVTVLLYERFQAFHGAADKGLLFLPTELIDQNGSELKRIILKYAQEWELGEDFCLWVETANKFTNTLVDRIVTGYPKDEITYYEEKLGYQDNLLVTSEVFHLWVIEGKKEWADILPIHKTDAHVIWTEDVTPYKKRKVRILNGAHTSTVLAAWLAGHNIVLDFMSNEIFQNFLSKIVFDEVIPTLDLPKEELISFAEDVFDRFSNPFIKHRLLDISLNSCSKFRARCLPSLLAYVKQKQELPKGLVFSLAAFMKFYQGNMQDGAYTGCRKDGTSYLIRDDAEVIDTFKKAWSSSSNETAARTLLADTSLWDGENMTHIEGLTDMVTYYLNEMDTRDIHDILSDILT